MQLLPEIDTSPVRDGRYTSLDGLRGVAAAVVVMHHTVLLLYPYFEITNNGNGLDFGSLLWTIETSPLYLARAGGEAVGIFFILSGFVLSLPFLRGTTKPSWLYYYPSRLLRLLLPTFTAIALAILSILLIARPTVPIQAGQWYDRQNWHTVPPINTWFHADVFDFLPATGSDNPIWSLNLEIIFSLLLPLYLLIAAHKRWGLMLSLMCYVVLIFFFHDAGQNGFMNLALFAIGVLLAAHRGQVFRFAEKIFSHYNIWFTGTLTTALALGLIWLPHIRLSFLPAGFTFGVCYPLGAGLLVLCAITSPVLRSILNHRVPQFLGRISFSLYLVHVPVLTACAYMFGINRQVIPATLLGVLLSVVLAVIFQRVIEAPSHRFAKHVGRLVDNRFSVRRSTDAVKARVGSPEQLG